MIKGTFRSDDLLAAQWVHLRPRRSLAIVGSLLILLALWGGVAMLFEPDLQGLGWVRWTLPASVLYLILWFAVLVPYRVRRSYGQRKDLKRELTFSASDSGLTVQTDIAQGTKPWSDYLKWKEGERVFLLYMSDNLFQVLPKRFFDTATEMDRFRALLQQHATRGKS